MSIARALRKQFDQGAGTLVVGSHIASVGNARTAAGISVSRDRALTLSAWYAGVAKVASSVAMLPFSVYERRPDGTRGMIPTHPVHRLIHWRADPRLSAFAWRELTTVHVINSGNGYSMIVRDGIGIPRRLWPLDPDRMDVEGTIDDPRYRYRLLSGGTVEMPPTAVFHLAGPSWDGLHGYSILRLAREDLGVGLAAREFGARFFATDAQGGVVLRHPKTLSDAARDRLARGWAERHRGLEKAWEPAILEEGMALDRLSLPPADAEMLATRKFTIGDMARWLDLTPHMLGDLERATHNSLEELGREFLDFSLMSRLVRWEAAVGLQLLADEWIGAPDGALYARHNVSAFARGNLETRYRSYGTGIQWGFLSANDVREMEDRDPVPGGDDYLRPLNMVSAGTDGSITTTTMTTRKADGAALRCGGCDRLLAEQISPPYRLTCSRCDRLNEG